MLLTIYAKRFALLLRKSLHFNGIMSLRGGAERRRSNLLLMDMHPLRGDCFGKNALAMTLFIHRAAKADAWGKVAEIGA